MKPPTTAPLALLAILPEPAPTNVYAPTVALPAPPATVEYIPDAVLTPVIGLIAVPTVPLVNGVKVLAAIPVSLLPSP